MKITDVLGMLTSAYHDWGNLLLNPFYTRNGNIITWNNYQSLFFNEPVQVENVLKLIELQQYSFQVVDGAIIQIYYAFEKNGNKLTGAKLAYYKIFNLDEFTEIDELSETDNNENLILLDNNATVSWLRIDYQPLLETTSSKSVEALGMLHSKCHLQISGFPNSRFPICGVPTPKQFIEFLMAFCYPEKYQKHRLDERGCYTNLNKIKSVNDIFIDFIDEDIFKLITHIKIPSRSH